MCKILQLVNKMCFEKLGVFLLYGACLLEGQEFFSGNDMFNLKESSSKLRKNDNTLLTFLPLSAFCGRVCDVGKPSAVKHVLKQNTILARLRFVSHYHYLSPNKTGS